VVEPRLRSVRCRSTASRSLSWCRRMPKDSRVQERLQRDIAVRDRSRVGRDQRRPEARLRCWRMDFNNNRRHEALGMRTLTELYRPDGTFDSANVVDLGIPSACWCVPSAAVDSSHRSRTIPMSSALFSHPVGIDPQSDPPYEAGLECDPVSDSGCEDASTASEISR